MTRRRDLVLAASIAALALVIAGALALFATRDGGAQRLRDGEVALREVVVTGTIGEPTLRETSGLAAPRATPGILWALNDSGNDAVLFRLDSTGAHRGTVRVDGAENRDWEALAAGPCPEGECLYIGDVGDNGAKHPWVRIVRVVLRAGADTATHLPIAAALLLRYDGGARDVEAMFVAPDTAVWLVRKRPLRDSDRTRWRPAHAYRVSPAAWQAGSVTVGITDSLPIVPEKDRSRDWVTDAALRVPASGPARLAVLTYGALWMYEADRLSGWPGRLVARCALSTRTGQYAEAVTWLADDRLLVIAEGRGAALVTGRCP